MERIGMRFCMTVLASAMAVAGLGGEESMHKPLSGKKVLIVVAADNFQEQEFGRTHDLMLARGAKVTLACSRKEKALGTSGRELKPDFLVRECRAEDYDAIVFIGGGGAAEYFDSADAHALARAAVEKGRVLGAICIAPAILANAGVLKGKKATVFPSERAAVAKRGAALEPRDVVVDGQIVTASGPQAAQQFAETLAGLIQ